ncbi:hypothetical protein OO013_18060 [Mangrovivirga sp. M17]|uniref:Uncharacterized protein n=1 Tax=Mangrovivirga halotolerans TaxID=2993936 RepID=A0ABT3RVI7_9BACT|nr:hypothetical protein [Mangrovivirga halotolerans]MCX2745793.1 hypothetical protein [Mangrovivirga halotolerans]
MKTSAIINKKSIWLTLGIMVAIMIGFTNIAKANDDVNCCTIDTISEAKVEKNELKLTIEFIENEILLDEHFGYLNNASYSFIDESNKVIFSKTYEFMQENEDQELANLLKNSELIMKDGDDHYYLYTGSQLK